MIWTVALAVLGVVVWIVVGAALGQLYLHATNGREWMDRYPDGLAEYDVRYYDRVMVLCTLGGPAVAPFVLLCAATTAYVDRGSDR